MALAMRASWLMFTPMRPQLVKDFAAQLAPLLHDNPAPERLQPHVFGCAHAGDARRAFDPQKLGRGEARIDAFGAAGVGFNFRARHGFVLLLLLFTQGARGLEGGKVGSRKLLSGESRLKASLSAEPY